MFADSFAINLVIFLAGQVVAYLYLRTGRRQRGLMLMIGAWILIDVVLVAKFAFHHTGSLFWLSLLIVQVWSLGEVCAYGFSRVRRRRKVVLARRAEEFRKGFQAYLKNDFEPAIEAFRGILRRDPWDLPTVVALATALARSGVAKNARKARSWWRVARDLDVDATFADVIDAESGRVAPRRASSSRP